MIQIKELRIGNYVVFQKDQKIKVIDVITGLLQERVILASLGKETLPLNNIQPVKLTSDILKSSGFQFTNDDWYERAITYGKLNYNLKYEVCSISDNDYTNECVLTEYSSIKYLHQLQNIYYSLAGKELEIVI